MRPRTGIAAFVTAAGVAGALAASAGDPGPRRASPAPGSVTTPGSSPGTCWSAPATTSTTRTSWPGRPCCRPGSGSAGATAIAGGDYPYVFNNDTVDGSFGVTSRLFLKQITPSGRPQGTIPVPSSDLVTSFSSKSEGALNLSTDGKYADVHRLRGRAGHGRRLQRQHPRRHRPDQPGHRRLLPGRGVAVGRTASGPSPRPTPTAATTAAPRSRPRSTASTTSTPRATPATAPTRSRPASCSARARRSSPRPACPRRPRRPGQPTPVGSFNVTELGDKADKVGKDDNFRGLTLYNNVLYYTKGSGSNGVNTVYFLDTTGTACPDGVGLPAAGAPLPTTDIASTLTSAGLASNMCVLKGFPTALAKSATDASDYPFGLWFANPTTLYVADEGAGDNAYSPRATATPRRPPPPRPACRSGSTTPPRASGSSPTPCRTGSTSARRTPCPGYPTGINSVTGAAVGAGHRRPAEHHRQGQPGRHRHHLGGHLDRQRRRRPGRRPEPAGRDHRQARRDQPAGVRAVLHRGSRPLRPGGARRVVHAGHGPRPLLAAGF